MLPSIIDQSTVCLQETMIWAKQRKEAEESAVKKHMWMLHIKLKQASGISVSTFCLRFSKEWPRRISQ